MNRSGPTAGQSTAIGLMLGLLLVGLIAFVYLGPKLIAIEGLSPAFLPKLNALLNGSCTLVLLAAWRAILRGKVSLHRRLMLTAVALSAAFLASYLVQHGSFPSVKYGGNLRALYYPLLVSHIILAAVIAPLVLITLVRALSARFDKHRRIARWTLPLWLYVSISGVLVYVMCAPYY